MLVRAADHQHVVAYQAVIAREDVGGNAESGDMPEMARPIRVRPRHRDKDALRHQ